MGSLWNMGYGCFCCFVLCWFLKCIGHIIWESLQLFSWTSRSKSSCHKASLHFIDRAFLPKDVIFYIHEDEWFSWKKNRWQICFKLSFVNGLVSLPYVTICQRAACEHWSWTTASHCLLHQLWTLSCVTTISRKFSHVYWWVWNFSHLTCHEETSLWRLWQWRNLI